MAKSESTVSKCGHYRSWYDVARKLTSPEDRLAFYDALDAYRFDGIEPENLPPIVDILWTAIKPNIDADINSRVSGADGGQKKGGLEKNGNPPSKNASSPLTEEREPPLDGKQKGAFLGDKKLTNDSLNTPLEEKKIPPLEEISNPPFEFSASNVDVDEDVEEDADADEDVPREGTVTVQAVENWLEIHGLVLPEKDMKRLTASLSARLFLIDYLDYALEYVSNKSYKSRDGTGRMRFLEIPEGNRKGLFLDAVLNWQDMNSGYSKWHRDRMQKESLCPVEKAPPKPFTCPACGSSLYEQAGESMCIKCNGYLEWGGRAWRIRPYPNRTLAEGIRQMNPVA